MKVLEFESARLGYVELLRYVRGYGELRSPRGQTTYDVGPVTVVLHDITNVLPIGVNRGVNVGVAAAEAVQLIGGFSSPELIVAASHNFERYMEPDGYFHGAYGERISLGSQLDAAVAKLWRDRSTRQAVITLWNPLLDNQPGKLDYPCTVMLHLAIRYDKLELSVVMRSQDVWLGTPYDWFQFTQLQWTIANVLGVEPGMYRHTTLSTHLYERDYEKSRQVTDDPLLIMQRPQPRGLTGASMSEATARARDLVFSPTFVERSESERWYHTAIRNVLDQAGTSTSSGRSKH